MNQKDIRFGAIAALLVGVLSLPTLNSNLTRYGVSTHILIAFILTSLTIIGLITLRLLSRWISILWQMAKFIVVGGLNTFLDFAVLNLLITATGVAAGGTFSFFKAISFSIAVMNSYLWNKYWTFEVGKGNKAEFMEFILVSLVGLGINVGSASLLVNFVSPLFGLGPVNWANLSALIATFLGLVWSFLGYKLIVFKKAS
ncbi:MAG: GtrA family protein [Candidatus Colwellbacteria bacterium]|nr:GtrA family protein [Candidatus Colwellbacteria bacterium]